MTVRTVNTLVTAPRLFARRFALIARPRPTCEPTAGRFVEVCDTADSASTELPHELPQTLDTSAAETRQAGIICGTDFSIHAREAADVAAAIASKLSTALTLVHALEPDRGTAVSKSLNAMLRYRNRNQLKREAERLRARGITVNEAFLSGSPPTELVKCAIRQGAGLIVVSSLGSLLPTGFLLGSVAEQTAHLSSIPVLVVRGPKPFKAWASGRKTLNIVVGHDFSASADAALAWVAALRKFGRCRITIAHLSSTQVASDWLEVNVKQNTGKSLIERRELLEKSLIQRCRGLLGNRFHVEVVSVRDSVAARLVRLAEAQDADLIVVGTNRKATLRRLCLGSVSRNVLREASISVACIPTADNQKEPA